MKPIQYQKGYVEFYKLKFRVTPDTLIPRPETELLVDEVLKFAKNSHYRIPCNLTIFDLGTGAGNIAISIAKNLSFNPKGVNVKIIATDISKKALMVAKQNSKLHQVESLVTFLKSDLLSFCYDKLVYHNKIRPTVIVSNLPYIPSSRIPYLDSSVKDFEPLISLDGGPDGFNLYRKLFGQIVRKKLSPKLIVAEIDYTHGDLAYKEAKKYFPQTEVEIKTDLAHKQRILLIRSFTHHCG